MIPVREEKKMMKAEAKRISGFGIAKGARPFEEEEEPHPDLW